MRKAMFPLVEGDVTLTFPADLSADSFDELNSYLQIFLKRAKRESADRHTNGQRSERRMGGGGCR
jgi:hypothetical protein